MRKEWTVEDVMEIGEEMRKQIIANAAPEERLLGLAPEELQALLKQLEAYVRQPSGRPTAAEEVAMAERRQTLIHVLQHKFGELPPTVVERITATADQARLTEWLDSALDAETLTVIDFGQ